VGRSPILQRGPLAGSAGGRSGGRRSV